MPPKIIKYLVDVNLPYYFSIWKSNEYVHQRDIDPTMSDSEIWDYAKNNNLTIITKDSDFSERLMFLKAPPKVIHIKLGNMKLKILFEFLYSKWSEILDLNKDYKIVAVYKDRIEAID